MTLSTKHRTALFDALAPLAGEEATEAMLAELPASENDELVTKQFLRAELADLRTELKGDIADLRTELKGDIADLRTELKGDINGLRTEVKGDINGLRTEVNGEFAKLHIELADSLRSQTHWILGAMLGLFGAVTTIGGLVLAFGR